MDERRLVQRLQRGESGAYSALLDHYKRPVYGYLCRCGVDAATRDDLFQEIFLKVQRAIHSFQTDRALRPWIFTIAANTVRSYYRKQRVHELVYPEEIASSSPTSQDISEARETAEWIEKKMATLPFAQREVIALVCIEQMPQAEVAAALQIPLNTVKTLLRRGRCQLAKCLARRNARMAFEDDR